MDRHLTLAFFLIFLNFSNSQTVIKLIEENGVYKVNCKVNGIPMKFIFDTGASEVSISLTEAKFLYKQGLINKDDILGQVNYRIANGQIVEGTRINLKNIQIENFILNNVSATVIDNDEAPLLLGQSALNKLGAFSINGDKLIINNISDIKSISLNKLLPYKMGSRKLDVTSDLKKSEYMSEKVNNDLDNIFDKAFEGIYTGWQQFDNVKDSIYISEIVAKYDNLSDDSELLMRFADDKLYKLIMRLEYSPENYNLMKLQYDKIINEASVLYDENKAYTLSDPQTNEKTGEQIDFLNDLTSSNEKLTLLQVEFKVHFIFSGEIGNMKKTNNIKGYTIKVLKIDLNGTDLTGKDF